MRLHYWFKLGSNESKVDLPEGIWVGRGDQRVSQSAWIPGKPELLDRQKVDADYGPRAQVSEMDFTWKAKACLASGALFCVFSGVGGHTP